MPIDASRFRWQRGAACKDVPSYIFFPEEQVAKNFTPKPGYEGKTFVDFCSTCGVRALCLEFALLHDLQGIWGGLTDREREKQYCAEERREMRDYMEEENRYEPLYGHS